MVARTAPPTIRLEVITPCAGCDQSTTVVIPPGQTRDLDTARCTICFHEEA